MYASLIDHAEGDAGEGTQISAAAPFDVAELANSPTAPSPITEPPIAESRAEERQPAVAAVVPRPNAESAPNQVIQTIGAEPKRITQTALQSQRVKADQLLANARPDEPVTPRDDRGGESAVVDDRGPHFNLPPAGATSAWYTDAMERALDKYRTDHGGPATGD